MVATPLKMNVFSPLLVGMLRALARKHLGLTPSSVLSAAALSSHALPLDGVLTLPAAYGGGEVHFVGDAHALSVTLALREGPPFAVQVGRGHLPLLWNLLRSPVEGVCADFTTDGQGLSLSTWREALLITLFERRGDNERRESVFVLQDDLAWAWQTSGAGEARP